MEISEAKATRAAGWLARICWDPVSDPRAARGTRYAHSGLLSVLVAAFASGDRTLRQVEEFAEDMPARARRSLGLRAAPSDTAFYRLFEMQDPDGLADVLEAQVKAGLSQKMIQHDLFPEGVAAMDGKCSWVGDHAAHPMCKKCHRDDGSPYWMLFAQRVVLVSSSARPCLYQQFIPDKTNEIACFAECFRQLNRRYGRSFEILTSDAGGCSRANGKLVHDANKAYVFALKENQPELLLLAQTKLGVKTDPGDAACSSEHRTVERYRGDNVTREIFVAPLSDEETDFPGARQLWRQRTTIVTPAAKNCVAKVVVEDRYFVTNRVFSADRALRLVRLHWGIENGANWTLDVAMGEDDGSPCTMGNGVIVVSWLRQLAYNLASLWRSKLDAKHGEAISWRRAFELLERALHQGLGLPAEPEAAPTTRA